MRARCLLPIVVLCAGLAGFAAPSARADVSVSISLFHERLSPHGRWVVAGSYGNCWAPSGVSAGWAPYVDGEWVWTDYGWTWDSLDPWGDVVYHYGTWVWVEPYGWVWVPGTIWAPAWVTWAYTDDYIGWAPVPPSFVLSAYGYSGRPIIVSQTRYVFVPTRQFVGVNVANVRVPVAQSATIFPRATKVTNFTVSRGIVHTAGPPPARIERSLGRRIERVPVERAKSKPTTIAAAGARTGGRLAVVAPAPQRARVLSSAPATSEHARKESPGRTQAQTPERGKERVAKQRAVKPQAGPQKERPADRTVRSEGARPPENGPRTGHAAGRVSSVPPAAVEPMHSKPQPRAERSRPQPHAAVAKPAPQSAEAHGAGRGQVKKHQPPPNAGHGKENEKKD